MLLEDLKDKLRMLLAIAKQTRLDLLKDCYTITAISSLDGRIQGIEACLEVIESIEEETDYVKSA